MWISQKYMAFVLLLIINALIINAKAVEPVLNIQNWNTTDGTRVLYNENYRLPMVDISVIFYAGSVHEKKDFGIATFTSTMLAKGTQSFTAAQISEKFYQLGAIFETNTNMDITTVNLRCLTKSEILDNALQVFISILTEPLFSEKECQKVRNQMLASIQVDEQTPESIAVDEVYKKLYNDFPYSHSETGIQETISKIRTIDLLKYYHTYYTAKNAVIIIVGSVTRKQAENIVDKIASKLPMDNDEAIYTLPELEKKPRPIISHIHFSTSQINVMIGQIGISYNDIDYFPLYIGNYILGGTFFISNLLQELREKRGLVYHVKSNFDIFQNPGPFIITFSTSAESFREALNVTLEVLKQFIQKGPSPEQLSGVKTGLIGRYYLEFASNKDIMNKISLIGVYNLPLNYYDTYVDKIKAVTLWQVKDAFKRRIDFNNMVIVSVGPNVNTSTAI